MAQEQDVRDRAAVDQFDGDLRFVLTTETDGDGEGVPRPTADRWVIDVRLPVRIGRGRQETVSIGRVTAVTILDPEDLQDITDALIACGADPGFAASLDTDDTAGGDFATLFETAAAMTDLWDLLVIDEVTVRDPFRSLPELVSLIVAGVRLGPAGRHAAFVLADPSGWDVDPARRGRGDARASTALRQLTGDGYKPWAGTDVLLFLNADPDVAVERAEGALGGPRDDDAPASLPFPVGTRGDEVRLGPMVEEAMTQPTIPVPFDLPPALPADIWAGLPEDIHGVDVDDETGEMTISTHTDELEVVGRPGNAPQLVGAATRAPAPTQQWLREVHRRWWAYWPDLHEQIHAVIDRTLDGTLEPADEDAPHLHIPNLPRPYAAWPGVGDVDLVPGDVDADPLTYEAVLDGPGGQEHIGVVLVHDDGHIEAFLHDQWNPGFPDHEAAVGHLITLGAEEYLSDVLHDVLAEGAEAAILTGHAPGH
jgi:hypothetical protein